MKLSQREVDRLRQEHAKLADDNQRLRHLLSEQMRVGEALEFSAIVNPDGTPLVNVHWEKLAAQWPVGFARGAAHTLLRVCEWAETDALLLSAARKAFDGDERVAGGLLALLREARGGDQNRSA